MIKHTTYLTIARAPTIGGIPRIALIISVICSTIPFPILSLFIDQMIAFGIAVSIFAALWLMMKIVSLNDPDAVLIAAVKLMKLTNKGDRYAA